MTAGDTTVDPTGGAGAIERLPRPVVVIVGHSDVRRLGDAASLEAGDGMIGRRQPAFARSGLDDPCISRAHLQVRWVAARSVFEVRAAPNARLGVKVFHPHGREAGLDEALPPGALIEIDGRVLLRLDLRAPTRGAALGMVGDSRETEGLRRAIDRVAEARHSVLINGEHGTGKERAARAVHDRSERAGRPFVALNCATLVPALAPSALFGHRRGAFTGADRDRAGAFVEADGGTLFLDEVGELPPEVQAQLLRTLQEGTVQVVGADGERPVDVRVVAATNRDLDGATRDGGFRRDLFDRLAALRLRVPPLRARTADVAPLFRHFFLAEVDAHPSLARLVRVADRGPPPMPMDFFRALQVSAWPGNVRGLQNLSRRTAVENLHREGFVAPALDGSEPRAPSRPELPSPATDGRPDRAALVAHLAAHDFRPTPTAAALGVARSTLHAWIRDAGLPTANDYGREAIDAAVAACGQDWGAAARRLQVSAAALKKRRSMLADG